MYLDTLLYIIFLIPFGFMFFYQEHLITRKNIFKYLFTSILVLICGILYQKTIESETKSLAYFGSQIPLIFLILHLIFGRLFFKIFKRYPVVDEYAKKLNDGLYSFFIIMTALILPVLIEEYIIKQF